jgi:hypothetical protein
MQEDKSPAGSKNMADSAPVQETFLRIVRNGRHRRTKNGTPVPVSQLEQAI